MFVHDIFCYILTLYLFLFTSKTHITVYVFLYAGEIINGT
ncbi:hypothetical protein CLOBOL_07310 [Enterocloster bolteae ATCC BAA-613]|uniref:Uncharacterized protein n=1 Tax=Enterocloster bolteae (strain ATCC BAA-613 / DSM 15670 / CCUG 46953 / JCM 12243 / WAL 16351) TaxID=411902 RepID=A8S5T2_ENTBW|nr:hypothetical protein CLOBOL_07310 [Enterocloster bolteae ATCC BAA-613]